MRKALVDIDSILWDFDIPLKEKVEKLYKLPPMEEWKWETVSSIAGEKFFYKCVDEIHMNQDKYAPFSDAKSFLETLKFYKYDIIIASHRKEGARAATIKFLLDNGLVYDVLHISHDKTVLFPFVDLVVDDCPYTLIKAKEHGITIAGLRYSWNTGIGLDDCLYSSLADIEEVICITEENEGKDFKFSQVK